jgi:Rhodopirellula transposase DDE domain
MGAKECGGWTGRKAQWDRLYWSTSEGWWCERWEKRQPEAATALRELAEAHAQQDPTFQTSIAYTRLTAQEAIAQLQQQGFLPEQLPAPSTMAVIFNRMGYRLQAVVKAKPQKNFPKRMRFLPTSKPKTANQTMAASNE